MLRTATAALILAVVMAVVEALLRWQLSTDAIDAPQLTAAVFANVAAVGLLSVLVAGAGCIVIRLLGAVHPKVRDAAGRHLHRVVLGMVAGVLVIQTGGLGLDQGLPDVGRVALWALVLAVVTAVLAGRADRSSVRHLSTGAKVGVVTAWLLCVGATSVALVKTDRHIAGWMRTERSGVRSSEDQPPSIVLIVLDTLRADRVGVYGHEGRDLTPNLDRLAESSIVYTKALSNAPWTLPTHASLFTGLYPDVHGVSWGHYKLEEDWPVLSELVRDRGYESFAVSNNWLLSSENGFGRGFDAFVETASDPYLQCWRLALRCGVLESMAQWYGVPPDASRDAGPALTNWLVRRRLETRASSSRPLLLFINYFEPHDPYRPPARYVESHLTPEHREIYRTTSQRTENLAAHACGGSNIFDESEIAYLASLYDAEVAYQDEALGELFETLDRQGVFDNSWVVVMSDHGELFGEWDMVYHTASSHFKLLHIPLVVRPPGGTNARRITAPVQPVDVFATLLEKAGVAMPDSVHRAYPLPLHEGDTTGRTMCVAQTHGASIAGLSITQRMNMQADLAHWLSWVDSVYADGYLLERGSKGRCALFHVDDDPRMDRDVSEMQPGRVQSMMYALDSWSDSYPDDGDSHEIETSAKVPAGNGNRVVVRAGAGG